jgi:ABC-type Fe3+ transport system permease subunit
MRKISRKTRPEWGTSLSLFWLGFFQALTLSPKAFQYYKKDPQNKKPKKSINEKGMEAAQVILILVVVVIVLIPVISTIAKTVSSRGVCANNSISKVGTDNADVTTPGC